MNPIVQHMAVEAERQLVLTQAERQWRAAEAAALRRRDRPHLMTRIQWLVGRLLISAGTRLHGMPRPTPMVEPAAPSPTA